MSQRKKAKAEATKYSNDKLLNRYSPKTENQVKYAESIISNTVTLAYGPSGVGKSAVALSLMCEHLVEGKVDRLIITKPFVESSPRGLGFLKGDIESKTAPYLTYFTEYMNHILGIHQFKVLLSMGKIEIVQIEYLRSCTFNNTYIFGDEFQNATMAQNKLILTRIGHNSKVILVGDPNQTDLIGKEKSGFGDVILKLDGLADVGIVKFDNSDIMRNGIIGRILERLES